MYRLSTTAGFLAGPFLFAACALCAAPAFAGALRINISGITVSPPTAASGATVMVSYTLSGSGMDVPGGLSGVRVDLVKDGQTVQTLSLRPGEAGAQAGANAFPLSTEGLPATGAYTVQVTAEGMPFSAPDYFEVSDPSDASLQFANPRGVDVNRAPGHPDLGRIYVAEGGGGATANRSTEDGVYVLNPDLTPAFPVARARSGDIGYLGPWAGSPNSPFRVTVGPDGQVYITDCSDAHSGVFVADADGGNVRSLFAYPFPAGGARNGSGLVTNKSGQGLYGSTSGIWVDGSDLLTVLTTDEDVSPGNALWKRTLPAGATGADVVPTLMQRSAASDWVQDVVRDGAGNAYKVSLATDDAVKTDANGTVTTTLPPNGVGYYGICIDDAKDTLLLASNDGKVFRASRAFNDSAAILADMGADVRDVATDAEGWIYALDATDRRLRVWAPPGDYEVAGGTASKDLTVAPTLLPGDLSPLGATGLYIGPNGRKYGDGRLDIADGITIMRVVLGLDPAP